MVHQSFKVSLDAGAYDRGLKKMESDTARSTSKTAAEFKKIDQSASRMGGGGGGRARGSQLAGGIALQAQDIAVQMQMGASAGRILVQQGTQIASLFGPTGMIVGGLAAGAVLLWEWANASKAVAKEAENAKRALRLKNIDSAGAAMKDDNRAAIFARIEADQGKEAADAKRREMEFEDKISEIRRKRDAGELPEGVANLQAGMAVSRKEEEDRLRNLQGRREQQRERIDEKGNEILARADQIRGKGLSKAEQRREDRAQARAERRAINEEMDAKDRKKRNGKQGTGDPAESGLSKKEKEEMKKAREAAVDAAKKGDKLELSDDSITKILNGIDGLIAR